jgi:uncharacterized protein YjbI with pentapeptide repeats
VVIRNTTTLAVMPLFTFLDKGTLSVVAKGVFSIVPDGVAEPLPGAAVIEGDVPEPIEAPAAEPSSPDDARPSPPEPTRPTDLPEIAPLRPAEAYFDPASQPLIRAADLVPLKASPEVLFVGSCHPPKPGAQACRVSIALGAWSKSLAVYGDRHWQKKMLGLLPVRTDPVPFDTMPLVWSRAFGGEGSSLNPAGLGLSAVERSGAGGVVPFPNIESPNAPIKGPGDRPPPAGFGPIAPMWEPRRSMMGDGKRFRYPEDWPWFPPGYDPAFFNASPPDQRIAKLTGDETVKLEHLMPGQPMVTTKLPGTKVRAWVRRAGAGKATEVEMVLDTVAIDGDAGTVALTWRGRTPCKREAFADFEELVVAEQPLAGPAVPPEVIDPPEAEPAAAPEPPGEPEPDPGSPDPERAERDEKVDAIFAEAETELARAFPTDGLPPLEAEASAEWMPIDGGEPSAALLERETRNLTELGIPEAEARGMVDEIAASLAKPEPPEPAQPSTVREKIEAGVAMPGADLTGEDLSGVVAPPGVDLTGANLKGADLTGASLEGAKLAGADLTGAKLAGVDLTGADLSGVQLGGADLSAGTFDRAVLANAKLERVSAAGAKFVDADAEGAAFDDADLTAAQLSGARLVSASLDRATLADASLLGVAADGASFEQAKVDNMRGGQGASFAEAVFTGSSGAAPSFDGSSLAGAQLGGVRWPDANLERANMDGVRASGARLPNAFMKNATARDADLSACDFCCGFLWCADISRSNVAGASLHGAEVFGLVREGAYGEGVDFTGTKLELSS